MILKIMISEIAYSCYRCKGNDIVQDRSRGDVICRLCGEVLSQRCIDVRPDWDDDLDINNNTNNYIYDTYEGSNTDSDKNISRNFSIAGSDNVNIMEQVERATRLLDTKQDNKIRQILLHVKDISSTLFLNRIVEDRAESIATRSIKESTRKFSNLPLATAAIYLACRMHSCSRTLKEMNASTGIDVKVINKLSKFIADNLNLDIGAYRVLPEHIVPRIASNLRLGSPEVEVSRAICQMISEGGILEGVDPSFLAAAVVLLVIVLSKKLPNSSFELQSHLIKSPVKKEIKIDVEFIADSAFCTASNIGITYDKLIKEIPHLILLKRMSSSDNDICIPTFDEIKRNETIAPITENIIIAINSLKRKGSDAMLVTPIKEVESNKKRKIPEP